MSRIAGIVSPPSENSIAALLSAASSSGEWSTESGSVPGASLGWTGWTAANVFQRDGILAVVDGCFFNRDELPDGNNDAARIGQLYRQHGFAGALQKINGDFAIALFDSSNQTLWLGRDRIGIKPLYYAHEGREFAFGSRPRVLWAAPHVRREVHPRFAATFAASHYRYFDNDPTSSPYQNIHQLPAGHLLQYRDGQVQLTRYWQLEEQPDWTGTEEELAERYRDLLLDAVRRRVTVANRPAFTLSGGMDSSSVLSSAVHTTGQQQHAFSTVYEDKTYDESEDIRTILAETVEEWHTVPLGTPDVFGVVERMIEAHDEPVATATWLSHYLLCENAAGKGFGGLFGGLGGDELNAGEYEYFWCHFADLRTSGQEQQLQHEIKHWIEYHDHPIFRKSFELVDQELPRIADLSQPGKCLPEEKRLARYYSTLNRDYFELSAFVPRMDHPFRSYLKNRTFQDIFRETAPCCLRAEDRQATAFNLENYLPFFDHRLVEFMFRVPGHHKIRDGVTKRLLREATKGILPDETRNRIKKTGWNAPAHVWFSGRGREPLMDLVHSQAFRERGVYNVPEVLRIVDEHEQIVASGAMVENHMMFLWQLVNLELWMRKVSDERSVQSTFRKSA